MMLPNRVQTICHKNCWSAILWVIESNLKVTVTVKQVSDHTAFWSWTLTAESARRRRSWQLEELETAVWSRSVMAESATRRPTWRLERLETAVWSRTLVVLDCRPGDSNCQLESNFGDSNFGAAAQQRATIWQSQSLYTGENLADSGNDKNAPPPTRSAWLYWMHLTLLHGTMWR